MEITKTYSGVSNIPIGVDNIDHFCFICPNCDKVMVVEGTKLDRVLKCFHFYLRCDSCLIAGQRKIYLKFRRGQEYCNQRTDDWKKQGGANNGN